ncbi:MAG: toll/interleukin-1 receptor domain-containing protein [Mesorhizobium sp.]|uniref:toll/interleukin-1 receptor domain-containing protein n=1 Tax=Mesorhizobium sp. TaxID=1871066 RepID=UPI000FE9D4DE|nr:toll/interleukin-1 receptor domain-containing protein [Mesorhizobium sp.]RWC10386.1 MAG: toll/interleukin-1 receptor domain-containing protein [Mesorhizobium sp.]
MAVELAAAETPPSLYEIGLLGEFSDEELKRLLDTISALISDFGLGVGRGVSVRIGSAFDGRERHAASVVAYFGNAGHVGHDVAQRAITDNVPVIPTIPANGDFATLVPDTLKGANGLRRRSDDHHLEELAIALLECIGLLRRQRRVFVSYRRVESRSAAVQLHDLLSERGFDVFLDTHDIRPGEPFQDVLWHRLCDSDVLVMLDTPTYFESKWTRQELGRARAKEIHVLRVVWPEHTPNKQMDFAETIYLDRDELSGGDGPIIDSVASQIAFAVEALRSRSIAARYMSITGKLWAEVTKIGGNIEGIGAHRAISVRLPDETKLWAYPIVGIPTAELLNDIADKAKRYQPHGMPVLLYDHVGIRDVWMAHLKWLDDNINSVRAIKVVEAGWVFAAWEARR